MVPFRCGDKRDRSVAHYASSEVVPDGCRQGLPVNCPARRSLQRPCTVILQARAARGASFLPFSSTCAEFEEATSWESGGSRCRTRAYTASRRRECPADRSETRRGSTMSQTRACTTRSASRRRPRDPDRDTAAARRPASSASSDSHSLAYPCTSNLLQRANAPTLRLRELTRVVYPFCSSLPSVIETTRGPPVFSISSNSAPTDRSSRMSSSCIRRQRECRATTSSSGEPSPSTCREFRSRSRSATEPPPLLVPS